MPELLLNVVASTQRIEVNSTNGTISVVNAGPQGVQGATGPVGSGVSLPTGGTTGQVLTKNSATNFDASFAAIPTPTNIANSQLAVMVGLTIKGNSSASAAIPQDLSYATVLSMLNITTPWIPLAGLYSGGWVDYGAPYGPAKYRKIGNDMVQLRGLIQSGATGVICTLPVGYRPQYEPIISTACYFGNAEIRVNTSGQVSLASVTPAGAVGSTWTSLTGVTFSTLA